MIKISLSSGHLKILKAVGYPAFFSMSFAIFLSLTFPAERFIPMAEAQLTSVLERKVSIEDLSISPFGSVSLTGVRIEVPQKDEDKKKSEKRDADNDGGDAGDTDTKKNGKEVPKPVTPEYYVEEMHLNVGIWALLWGDLELQVEMDFLGGNIEVQYRGALSGPKDKEALSEEELQLTPAERANLAREKEAEEEAEQEEGNEVSFSLVATDLNLIQFWDLKDFLPLPMFGKLGFGIELKTNTGKFKDAEGKMWVDGKNISLGKGQSKVEVIDGMGPMTVDSIGIASLLMEMAVKEGKCSFRKVNLVSTDIAATAEGDIQFGDPFSRSRMNLYFTFKLLEGYEQKSTNAKTLVSLMPGALSKAKRPDGFYGYAFSGMFKTAKFRPSKAFSATDRSRRSTLRRGNRPTARNRSVTRKKVPPQPPRITPPLPPKPEPEPEPEPEQEPEPEPEPEEEEADELVTVTTHGTPNSDDLRQRQNDSQSKRTEAMLKARAAMAAVEAEKEDAAKEDAAKEDAAKEGAENEEGTGEKNAVEKGADAEDEPDAPDDE